MNLVWFSKMCFSLPPPQKKKNTIFSNLTKTSYISSDWGVASQLVDALWTALAEVRGGPLHTPTVQSEMMTLVNRGKNV